MREMKKIGLLTYHHVLNPGSIMQCACLYRLLQSTFPSHIIEIIDYYPEDSQKFNQHAAKHGKAELIVKFREFLEKNCRFSEYQILSDDVESGMQILNAQGYDAIFVGSDTVFQIDGYLGRKIAGPSAPNLYYLPGPMSAKKIGASVSFDPPQEASPEQLASIRQHLGDFDQIFYRDAHAYDIMCEAGISKPMLAYTPDPTIMTDFSMLIAPEPFDSAKSKKFGISIQNDSIRAPIWKYLQAQGYEVIDCMHLAHGQPKKKKKLFPWSKQESEPYEFIDAMSIYRKMNGLITDRFHGTIFSSILCPGPVVGIEDDTVYSSRSGKVRDLYERLGCADCIIRSVNGEIELSQLESALNKAKQKTVSRKIAMEDLRHEGITKFMKFAETIAAKN
ncbi:polysaccharide pyruvyl transferase family protein [Cerasicoccus frondis]|uniref:polysaccharide pyruvyl transferase family protein n=1 Tax=Cerasicoccus frondis TaxID=490090 RepID=UPI0028527E90|nr:polysaccharide pyruvyl transferase family protein [Cerasicoccus frondis]